jgi:hypothetical protein
MDDTTDEQTTELDEPVVDATSLIVEESVIDDESYEELMIILDLRRPDRQDAWLC